MIFYDYTDILDSTLDEAMQLIHKDLHDKHDDIEREMKRIQQHQEEITRYRKDLVRMQSQLDMYLYSLSNIQNDHLDDMKAHETKTFRNLEKMKENKKRHGLFKSRFDKYRKAIGVETRLVELKSKIKSAWKRDEIWAGIRDWGFLSILLFLLVIASFIALADF